ncbi:phytanoyl-dioxygenase family protein [Stagonosporopsis vannaccii]|nr:phytanoyl-dioxygenase family protein [Stagonosporopsis vannaccii]
MFPTAPQAVQSQIARLKHKLDVSRIRVSREERRSLRLNRQHVQKGLENFHRDGFVILENAVSDDSLEHIHRRMLQDFSKHHTSSLRWNQGRASGNASQPLPSLLEYLHEDVWANHLGVDIMENIIGPRPQLSLATSNIALPKAKGRQAVHSDYYCRHLDFPVFLEVNIYLHNVNTRNGATEFWLGTHRGYSKDDHSSPETGWIKQEVFTARAAVCPPIQPAIAKGSLMIRDLRCWHAGRANETNDPRIILGFIFSPVWFGSQMRMRYPCSARPLLESWNHIDCLTSADFVANNFDYLAEHQDINLTQIASDPNAPYIPRDSVSVTPQDYWTHP